MKTIDILGVTISSLTFNEALSVILRWAKEDKQRIVVTPNPEMLLEAYKNQLFKDILNYADLAVPDGIGLQWAACFSIKEKDVFNKKIWRLFPVLKYCYGLFSLLSFLFHKGFSFSVLPERISGTDLITHLLQDQQTRFFLLGASESIADRLKEQYSANGIQVVGSFSGSPQEKYDDQIVERINQVSPEILFVAFGTPSQELWIARNLYKIPSVKVAIGVGGAFDFLSGKVKRAPHFLQTMRLEWLYRLLKEPRKRYLRIYHAVIVFPLKVFKNL